MIAYYRDWDEWDYELKELRPTGRWKERTTEDGSTSMYVEHQGFILKHWIHERDIVFKEFSVGSTIFNCKRS